MRTSYKEADVKLLLKDITGQIQPRPTEERERLIQSGKHYCEMLPIEYVPSEAYLKVYREALQAYAGPVAEAVGTLAEKILAEKGPNLVLVSLARAGIPIGILLKRYLIFKYGIDPEHYSISIIRGKGIDHNAMEFLLERYEPDKLVFVDGWVGKGAILGELKKALKAYPGVSAELAVAADPAHITRLYGTREDLLIPSACLNSTVSGLISRTVLREDLIGEKDFHGAVYYGELQDADVSYEFITAIAEKFTDCRTGREPDFKRTKEPGFEGTKEPDSETAIGPDVWAAEREEAESQGMDEVREIAKEYGITDLNLVKPGIGEATRVLLRRMPDEILLDEKERGSRNVKHIVRLAEEKGVPISYRPLKHYRACGIIKKLADA